MLLLRGEEVKKPLTKTVLQDPENKIVKLILYMYSMEPPLYADLMKASLDIDYTNLMIKSLGPYSRILFEVLTFGDILDQ